MASLQILSYTTSEKFLTTSSEEFFKSLSRQKRDKNSVNFIPTKTSSTSSMLSAFDVHKTLLLIRHAGQEVSSFGLITAKHGFRTRPLSGRKTATPKRAMENFSAKSTVTTLLCLLHIWPR